MKDNSQHKFYKTVIFCHHCGHSHEYSIDIASIYGLRNKKTMTPAAIKARQENGKLGGRPTIAARFDNHLKDGNGIIVTLSYGWSFHSDKHTDFMTFEDIKTAKEAIKGKNLFRCNCNKCQKKGETK